MNKEEKVMIYLKTGKILTKVIAKRELDIDYLNTQIFRLRDEGYEIPGPVKICKETGRKMSHYSWGKQRG